MRCFIRYHNYGSPGEIKSDDVTAFLTYLAVSRQVSPNTQNQAFNALLFLFRHVLGVQLENIDTVRAKETRRIPVVLNSNEVNNIISQLKPPFKTMVQLAWGSGMRKTEILRLRIKDIDFDRQSITVREGKGRKDRITILPQCAVSDIQAAILRANTSTVSTSLKVLEPLKCLSLLRKNTLIKREAYIGNLFLPQTGAALIPVVGKNAGTTYILLHWKSS
ncbi:MAG: phage integrase N-terminal SAM-like domain-containing protein [Porticoccaceae bacterium]